MASQVTEYLNITGSNRFVLAVEEVDDGIMLPCVPPLVQGNIGIKLTMKLPIHMVCSCKFVRVDVCVGSFMVNLVPISGKHWSE